MADRQSTANNMMLREKYNTTIDMIGTTAFLPGGSVFLDPAPLDLGYSSTRGSFARQLGLGGLYTVLYVDHQMDFVRKSWTTSLDTKWESYGDGTTGDNPPSINPCGDLLDAERPTGAEVAEVYRSTIRESNALIQSYEARIASGNLDSTEEANLNDSIRDLRESIALNEEWATTRETLEELQNQMGTPDENRAPANSAAEDARNLERIQRLLRRRRGNGIDNGDIDENLYNIIVNEGTEDE